MFIRDQGVEIKTGNGRRIEREEFSFSIEPKVSFFPLISLAHLFPPFMPFLIRSLSGNRRLSLLLFLLLASLNHFLGDFLFHDDSKPPPPTHSALTFNDQHHQHSLSSLLCFSLSSFIYKLSFTRRDEMKKTANTPFSLLLLLYSSFIILPSIFLSILRLMATGRSNSPQVS